MDRQSLNKNIYIIDDEPEILMAVETCLKMAGMNNIIPIQDSRDVMTKMQDHPPCMVILDLNMPHINGERLLKIFSDDLPDIPVIILTGTIDVDTAVRCMKSGAMDYVIKPVEEERLLAAVKNARAYYESRHPNTKKEPKPGSITKSESKPENEIDLILKSKTFENIITRHEGMQTIFEYMRAVAPSKQPILIMGETGVGKELIAQSLHALSESKGSLITVNVAGLDDNIFSDTLFGHIKGAYTGADGIRKGLIEQAENGTLLLDEIGDLGMSSQVKLLRLLQEKEYLPLGSDKIFHSNTRIIASTNQDLWALEKKGIFRKDLIYRLATHTIQVPPLRQRTCDLPLLLNQFIHHAAQELNKPFPLVSSKVIKKMESYPFEGNIRELRSMAFDAMSQYTSGQLTLELFDSLCNISKGPKGRYVSSKLPTLKQASDHLVTKAMEKTHDNQSAAAKILGISQQALSKRLQKLKSKD